MLAGAGCRTTSGPVVADTIPIERHNWWNYYARAQVYLRDGQVVNARQDFERSLGLRRGAKFGFPRDSWRVRTYGLHFIESYFPNRELGVCLYELNETAAAVGYLEKSLELEPSGRARHYLNLCRQRLLQGKTVAKPLIALDEASRVRWTSQRERTLCGTASGPGLISRISIDEKPQFIELAEDGVVLK